MIHVITASRNRKDKTEAFVRSLKSQTYKKIHLLLVDDGSVDGTRETVRQIMPKATIIEGNGSLWWGGALHESFKWVRLHLGKREDDYVFITNDDVQYPSDYIEKGIEYLNMRKNGIANGEAYDAKTKELVDTVYHVDYSRPWNQTVFYRSQDHQGECCSTRSLFMTVRTFLDTGGFHPLLLPHYGSDTEWTMRAARKGHLIYTYDDFNYEIDEDAVSTKKLKLSLKNLMSRRSNVNPVYRMNLLILSTPRRYLVREIARQLMRYMYKFLLAEQVILKKAVNREIER